MGDSRTRRGIEKLNAIEFRTQAVCRRANDWGSAEQRRLARGFSDHASSRCYNAVVLAFCQHNSLRISMRPSLEGLKQLHGPTLPQAAKGAVFAGLNLLVKNGCAVGAWNLVKFMRSPLIEVVGTKWGFLKS